MATKSIIDGAYEAEGGEKKSRKLREKEDDKAVAHSD
jgi:hypothetical protein